MYLASGCASEGCVLLEYVNHECEDDSMVWDYFWMDFLNMLEFIACMIEDVCRYL